MSEKLTEYQRVAIIVEQSKSKRWEVACFKMDAPDLRADGDSTIYLKLSRDHAAWLIGQLLQGIVKR